MGLQPSQTVATLQLPTDPKKVINFSKYGDSPTFIPSELLDQAWKNVEFNCDKPNSDRWRCWYRDPDAQKLTERYFRDAPLKIPQKPENRDFRQTPWRHSKVGRKQFQISEARLHVSAVLQIRGDPQSRDRPATMSPRKDRYDRRFYALVPTGWDRLLQRCHTASLQYAAFRSWVQTVLLPFRSQLEIANSRWSGLGSQFLVFIV